MHIDHVAIWTKDLERLKAFYETYFYARAGNQYVNSRKQFESYFLTFDSEARLEIMYMPAVPLSLDQTDIQATGYAHLSFGVGSKEEVDRLTGRLQQGGYRVMDGPRTTGDGYYADEQPVPGGRRPPVECYPLPYIHRMIVWGDGLVYLNKTSNEATSADLWTGILNQNQIHLSYDYLNNLVFLSKSGENTVNPAGTWFRVGANVNHQNIERFSGNGVMPGYKEFVDKILPWLVPLEGQSNLPLRIIQEQEYTRARLSCYGSQRVTPLPGVTPLPPTPRPKSGQIFVTPVPSNPCYETRPDPAEGIQIWVSNPTPDPHGSTFVCIRLVEDGFVIPINGSGDVRYTVDGQAMKRDHISFYSSDMQGIAGIEVSLYAALPGYPATISLAATAQEGSHKTYYANIQLTPLTSYP